MVMEARPSDSRLTQPTLTEDWPSTRRRRIRSASPGLSSISNTRVVWSSILLLVWGWACQTEPELFSRRHCGETPPAFAFSDVAVRVWFITARFIRAQVGGTGNPQLRRISPHKMFIGGGAAIFRLQSGSRGFVKKERPLSCCLRR